MILDTMIVFARRCRLPVTIHSVILDRVQLEDRGVIEQWRLMKLDEMIFKRHKLFL